jgi:asparagine synthase (glutamine-hydrolysing)
MVYTVGMPTNNEFDEAIESAVNINKSITKVTVNALDLVDTWKSLTRIRGEPLSLPNEGLIYNVCNSMKKSEKVVLTGEGADELLFGYDQIYRWAVNESWVSVEDFLIRYGYSSNFFISDRFFTYLEDLRRNKSLLEFVEDFFYDFHLTGLLRRMDFSSMAASKEARVPFVDTALVNYMYRRDPNIKISETFSKLPLRNLAVKLNLIGTLNRKKIGFSASMNKIESKFNEYSYFQQVVLKELGW